VIARDPTPARAKAGELGTPVIADIAVIRVRSNFALQLFLAFKKFPG